MPEERSFRSSDSFLSVCRLQVGSLQAALLPLSVRDAHDGISCPRLAQRVGRPGGLRTPANAAPVFHGTVRTGAITLHNPPPLDCPYCVGVQYGAVRAEERTVGASASALRLADSPAHSFRSPYWHSYIKHI
eukprot:365650-Chlamydomonas_euryale.AAC.8